MRGDREGQIWNRREGEGREKGRVGEGKGREKI